MPYPLPQWPTWAVSLYRWSTVGEEVGGLCPSGLSASDERVPPGDKDVRLPSLRTAIGTFPADAMLSPDPQPACRPRRCAR